MFPRVSSYHQSTAKPCVTITATHEQELLTLRNTLKVQRAEEKDLCDSAIVALVARRSSRLAARVPKTPTTLSNQKKVCIGSKRKASALDLNTPTPKPENGANSRSEYEYTQSTASEASHMADKSPMVEDVILAPSPINKDEHMLTPSSWFTTPDPPTPATRPESTTPKPTVTDPILLALTALTTAVGDLKSGITSVTQRVEDIEQGKNRPWGRDELDIPRVEDYAAKEDNNAIDFPMHGDDNTGSYLQRLSERQAEEDVTYDHLHAVFRSLVDKGFTAPFPSSLVISNSDFVEVTLPLYKQMKWDSNTCLTDTQMFTLTNTWNCYVARANAPIGDLDITKLTIPNSFARVTPQTAPHPAPQEAPHPDHEAGWASASKTLYNLANKATKWSAPVTYAKQARSNKGKGKAAPSTSPPTSQTIGPSPQSTPSPHPQSLLNKKKPGPRPLPQALMTTEYIVIIDHSTLIPPTCHPHDITQYVRQAQHELAEVQVDVTLLAGRWSSPHSGHHNFVFVFEGKVEVNKISKYDSILFSNLGPNCRSVPSRGYASVMFFGVPCFKDDDGYFPSPEVLEAELRKNVVCCSRKTLAPLRWLGSPARYTANSGHSGSVIWSFHNLDGTGLELICRSPPAFFGTYCRACKFNNCPALSQCDQCHQLGHMIANCPRPPSTMVCYHCGGPHHSSNHSFHCRNPKAHPG
jgi:hypothetical protein